MKTKRPVLGGNDQVKVAVAQISPAYLDREKTVSRAVKAIEEAGKNGAGLVVFPEVWLAGYPFWTEGWDSEAPRWVEGRVRFHAAALLIPSEDTERLCEAARKAGIYVVLGCNELDSRPGVETIYNTMLFIGSNGRLLGRHRKLMPTFVERMYWGMGDADDLVVFETDIGRIGGLICGEHLMTTVRAAMIAQGEDIHVAMYPGCFGLQGPRLQEPDQGENFWGHFSTRAHAMEAGAFVVCACGYLNPDDVPDDFPYKDKMNIDWANGGSSIISPLGVPIVKPQFGEQIVYGSLHANMIRATKALVDSIGHYSRPDVLKLMVRRNGCWETAEKPAASPPMELERDSLRRSAERHDVDSALVEQAARQHGIDAE